MKVVEVGNMFNMIFFPPSIYFCVLFKHILFIFVDENQLNERIIKDMCVIAELSQRFWLSESPQSPKLISNISCLATDSQSRQIVKTKKLKRI